MNKLDNYSRRLKALPYPELHAAYVRALKAGNKARIGVAQDEVALRLDRLHGNP
jgi:hypothetical protein